MTVLGEYRKNNNLTYKELSSMLSIPISRIFRLCNSFDTLKLRDAVTIEEKTGIEVRKLCSSL